MVAKVLTWGSVTRTCWLKIEPVWLTSNSPDISRSQAALTNSSDPTEPEVKETVSYGSSIDRGVLVRAGAMSPGNLNWTVARDIFLGRCSDTEKKPWPRFMEAA